MQRVGTSQHRVTIGAPSPCEFIRPVHRESRQAGKAGSSRISCITGKLSHFNKDLFKIFIFLVWAGLMRFGNDRPEQRMDAEPRIARITQIDPSPFWLIRATNVQNLRELGRFLPSPLYSGERGWG